MTMLKSLLFSSALIATAATAAAQEGQGEMNFFVTSVGVGDGADLGGLAGADAHCQKLADAAGAGGRQWVAYLSTQAMDGTPAINARDRIGNGPYYNAKGRVIARDKGHLHGDTLEDARAGNLIGKMTALSEKGEEIKGVGDTPNEHDILTGTQLDGTAYRSGEDRTCMNWTSNDEGSAQVGHHDRNSSSSISWVSAHPSRGCSQTNLERSGGAGLFYCFTSD